MQASFAAAATQWRRHGGVKGALKREERLVRTGVGLIMSMARTA